MRGRLYKNWERKKNWRRLADRSQLEFTLPDSVGPSPHPIFGSLEKLCRFSHHHQSGSHFELAPRGRFPRGDRKWNLFAKFLVSILFCRYFCRTFSLNIIVYFLAVTNHYFQIIFSKLYLNKLCFHFSPSSFNLLTAPLQITYDSIYTFLSNSYFFLKTKNIHFLEHRSTIGSFPDEWGTILIRRTFSRKANVSFHSWFLNLPSAHTSDPPPFACCALGWKLE